MPRKIENIIGLKYNRLTITGEAPKRRTKSGQSKRYVYTICDCGKPFELLLNSLRNGNTKSCGCGKLNGSKLSNEIYDGIVFGKLMVINEVEGKRRPGGSVSRVMKCECECGKTKNIRLDSLKSGKTLSCGCWLKKAASETNAKKLTIGQERGNLILLKEVDKITKYNERGGVSSTVRNVEVACKKCGQVREMTVFRFTHESQADDCGCSVGENISKRLKKDIQFDKKYGRLIIVKEVEGINFHVDTKGNKYFRRRVQCKCECGEVKDIDLSLVVNGHVKSCGCLLVDVVKGIFTTHGLTATPEGRSMYVRWHGILGRCYDANNPGFIYYGARGIKMCERWRSDIMNFVNDMGYPPSNQHSLDRIDVNGDYEPNNCRWVTIDVQSMNKRSNKWYKNKEKNPTI